jgi:hypothetical protein
MIGPMLGCKFQAVTANNPATAMGSIEAAVAAGFDVPMRISWDRPGAAQDSGHFLLIMGVRGSGNAKQLQIHDPWSGNTAWVNEGSIASNSLAPLFNDYARLTHVYLPK